LATKPSRIRTADLGFASTGTRFARLSASEIPLQAGLSYRGILSKHFMMQNPKQKKYT